MSILRCLDQCTLESSHTDVAEAVHAVVGFVCGMSRLATAIWVQAFEDLRACCFAKRQRDRTRALMFTITDHLGEMYKEISAFHTTLQQGKHSVSPAPFL